MKTGKVSIFQRENFRENHKIFQGVGGGRSLNRLFNGSKEKILEKCRDNKTLIENNFNVDMAKRQKSQLSLKVAMKSGDSHIRYLKVPLKTPSGRSSNLSYYKEHSKIVQKSPKNESFLLKIEKEALHRPYNPQDNVIIEYKEVPIAVRSVFWRKKKIQQYKIAKSKGNNVISTPNLVKIKKTLIGGKRNRSLETLPTEYSFIKQTCDTLNTSLPEYKASVMLKQ